MDIDDLLAQVKRNCTVSDARFWGFYSVCGLLLRMREMYLTEHAVAPWEPLPHSAIADWISVQEKLWQEREDDEFRDIVVDGARFSPFDSDAINALLAPTGLCYGAGYGTFSKPVFYVGKLESDQEVLDYRVRFVSNEVCRDLSIHPAMLQGRCITIRTDAVRAILWDKFQTVSARQCRGPASNAFGLYGLTGMEPGSKEFLAALERMTADSSGVFLQHEIGEAFEDEQTDDWLELLGSLDDRYAELYLRGVKDCVSDMSVMGPVATAVKTRDRRMLVLYAGLLESLRRDLLGPSAEIFALSSDWDEIEAARTACYGRMTSLRESALDLWNSGRSAAAVAGLVRSAFPPARNRQ